MKEAEIYCWVISYIVLGIMLVHSEISEAKLRNKRNEILQITLKESALNK